MTSSSAFAPAGTLSSPLLRVSTFPLLHFSASPLLRVADGWTDGRMDANDTICLCVANDFVQAEKRTSSASLGQSPSEAEDFVQADVEKRMPALNYVEADASTMSSALLLTTLTQTGGKVDWTSASLRSRLCPAGLTMIRRDKVPAEGGCLQLLRRCKGT
jgi:hypothetical protein